MIRLLALALLLLPGLALAQPVRTGPLQIQNRFAEILNDGSGAQSAARNNLGLGSLATQAAGAVAITGGTIGGISSLGVTGNAAVSGDQSIGGNLTVSGTITAVGGSFLPLAGGTLTGGVNGTTLGLSGNGTIGGTLGVTGSASAAGFTSTGLTAVTAGSGSSNHIALGPAATGSTPTITGTGDKGLGLAAQNNQSVKVLGGGSVWSGADNTGFLSSLTGTGTSTSAGGAASPFFNSILVTESLDRSIVTTTPVTALNVQHNYGGGTTKGGRQAQTILLLQQGGANTDSGADNFYVGLQVNDYARASPPGASSTNPLGRIIAFAADGQIQAGFTGTNWYQVAAAEFNVELSAGSTAALRDGVVIADLNGTAQGYWADNALWFYGAGAKWRYGINFGDTQTWPIDNSLGTMIGARYGAGRNAAPDMAAMWGFDVQQVAFPSTGNPYDGGPFRSKNFAVDGAGTVQIGTAFLTPGSTGLAIDAKGAIGTAASIAAAGSGYEAGTIVVTAFGGVWTVPTVAGVPTGAVTTLVQPVIPSTTPPSNPVTVTNLNRLSVGSGLTLNLTWNTSATTLALSPSGGPTTVGGTLGVTGVATLGQANTNTVSSTVNTSAVLFKNGPAGPIMLRVGGSAATIEADTNIVLSGGTWGSGALVNNTAPIFQNASFAGSTSSPTAAFGAWLQQTDNSSNTNGTAGVGFYEHLILNGSSVVGGRSAGLFTLDINATTGNTNGKQYTALLSKCNLMATDPAPTPVAYSTCFGANPVGHLGAGITAQGVVGMEANTWVEAGVTVANRIGIQIVDISGSTFGTQATVDDVALSLNNQYGPSSTLGYKVGIGFGRSGGNPPVATNGTLIAGQGNLGAGFTVANGIDWHLGTATGNWLNMAGMFLVDGSGVVTGAGYKVAATAGLTCSGTPTSSFASTGGIVTHC